MVSSQKRFRQGQIVKLVSSRDVASQDDLRRLLARLGMRVTQATLSRDIQELKLVKTAEGYRVLEPEGAAVPGNRASRAPCASSCWMCARRRTCWC